MGDIIRIPIDKGWMPDIPAYELPDGGLIDCKDCYPLDYEYVGIPGEVTATATAPSNVTDVIYDYEYQNIIVGTQAGLYRYAANNNAFTGVSRTSTYSGVNRWQFAFYGEWILATNGFPVYPPQVLKGRNRLTIPDEFHCNSLTASLHFSDDHDYTVGDRIAVSGVQYSAYNGAFTVVAVPNSQDLSYVMASTATGTASPSGTRTSPCFQDLGGAPPSAYFMLLVKDHLLLANCYTATGAPVITTHMPLRLYYSAEGNIEDWTPSINTGCGYQDFPDAGYQITGLESLSDDTFAVFADRSIYIGRYSGYPYYFTFQKIQPDGVGAFSYSTIVANGGVYFISTDYDISFLSIGGLQKLNVPFRETLRTSFLYKGAASDIQTIHDEENNLIIWYIPKGASSKLIIYNYKTQQFAYRDKVVEALARHYVAVTGVGSFVRSGFLKSAKLITFSSTTRDTLTLETKEITHPQNNILNLTRVRPKCNHDTSTKTVSIGNRKLESASSAYSTAVNVDADGYANTRVANRLLSVKLTCQRIGRNGTIDCELADGGKQ